MRYSPVKHLMAEVHKTKYRIKILTFGLTLHNHVVSNGCCLNYGTTRIITPAARYKKAN